MHACMPCGAHLANNGMHHAQGLDLGGGGKSGGRGGRASVEELAEVYDIMLTHGFREEHVQQALQASEALQQICLSSVHTLSAMCLTI